MAGCSLTGGAVLQFILIFTTPPVTRDKVIARFLETGGQPPPGVRQLGRWTQLDLCGGMVLLENDNPQALTAFAHARSDVVHLTLVPVLEDRALSEVLKQVRPLSAPTETHAEDASPETYPEDSPAASEITPGTTKSPYEEIA
jgi:hypothetical protein